MPSYGGGSDAGLSLDRDGQLSNMRPISSVDGLFREEGVSGEMDVGRLAEDFASGLSSSSLRAGDNDDGDCAGSDLSLDDVGHVSASQAINDDNGDAARPPTTPPSDFASARARIEAFSKNPDGYLTAAKSSTTTAATLAPHWLAEAKSVRRSQSAAANTAQTTSALDRMSRDASPAELRQLLTRYHHRQP